ncbi:MAG: DNRLRE domain-containing protein, partial [Anaerolineae bacterium]
MITWRRLLLVLLIALLIVTAALAVSSPIQAQDRRSPAPLTEATLIAVSDTYLDEADPAANFGDSRTLSVGRTDRRVPTETHLLVRFDLAGIPAGAILDRAELRLYQRAAGESASFVIYVDEVNAPWDEMATTWRTGPPATYRDDPPMALDQATGLKRWDVLRIVDRWLTGLAPNEGFLLRGDG